MDAIRNMYSELGVDEFYREYGNEYKNPHADIIKKLLFDVDAGDSILDLCCGSGEVTRCFPEKDVTGCDPYTHELYKKLTGREVLTYSFKDIALGALSEYRFDTVICSFALHLCEGSLLNQVLFQLAVISNKLIILTPHKRPVIRSYWRLEREVIIDRVRLREYYPTV